jgi:hypothetical protein
MHLDGWQLSLTFNVSEMSNVCRWRAQKQAIANVALPHPPASRDVHVTARAGVECAIFFSAPTGAAHHSDFTHI